MTDRDKRVIFAPPELMAALDEVLLENARKAAKQAATKRSHPSYSPITRWKLQRGLPIKT